MVGRLAIFVLSAARLVLASSLSLSAQNRRGASAPRRSQLAPPQTPAKPAANPPFEEFERMTPEQRQQALAKLPPDRRAKIQKQLEAYEKLTPEQRELARKEYETFRQLPPERQEAVRQAFQKFRKESLERQQAMREELLRLRPMSPAERESRFSNPEFRKRFDRNEQQMLREMSGLLPRS